MVDFSSIGGNTTSSIQEVAKNVEAVFVMVMNGHQTNEIIFGDKGLANNLAENSVIILTSTIKPHEAKEIGEKIKTTRIHIIDSPVSGGYPGAQSGTLTLMCAGNHGIINKYKKILP